MSYRGKRLLFMSLFLTGLLVLLCAVNPVMAAQITLTPVADTDTQSDVAAGTNPTLNCSQYCLIYVKFNLSGITGNITAATFSINHPSHSVIHTLNLNNASPDSWTEGGAKPTMGSNISSQSVSGVGYKEFNVTSLIQTEAAGDDLITFGLTTNLGTWEAYNARESATPPQLVVTYDDVGITPTATVSPTATPTPTVSPTPTPTISPSGGTPTPNTIDAKKTLVSLSIDGNLNESVWSISTGVTKIISGTPNNTVTYGVLWDTANLYIGARVLDANLYNDSTNVYDDDSVEIYIDANHNHGTSYDSSDRQVIKGYNDSAIWEQHNYTTGIAHAWATVSGGYSVEMAIPWSNLGITGAAGVTIGFDLGNNDDDNGSGRESQLMWAGTGNNWTDTSAFGNCYLSADTVGGGASTSSATATPTPTVTPTATVTPTVTITPTATVTATVTPTITPTPIITPTVSSNGTIGNTEEGTSTDNVVANYYNAIRYQASAGMTVNEMKIKIASSGTGKMKCAIYSDSGGNPGSFLMGTEERTNPGTNWQVFKLTSSLALTGGSYYWLVTWRDSSYGIYATTSTGCNWWGALTYAASWPASLPVKQGQADLRHSFYAYYNAASSPVPTPTVSMSPTPTITPTVTPPTGRMPVGANFWNKGWGSGWADYFASGVNWSTTTNPWRSAFISDLTAAKYTVLRFMDWVPTNSSNVRTWSQRIQKTADHYSSAGVAYEWQIDLCNRIGADIWITVPHLTIEDYEANATNNYWTQLADLLKNNLNSNLNIWLEYSNETWSGGGAFLQGDYCGSRGTQMGFDSDAYTAKFIFHVYAAMRLHKVFLDKFAGQTNRIKTVVAGQAGTGWNGNMNWGCHVQCLALRNQTPNSGNNNNINPWNLQPQYYTTANYTGGSLNGASANIRAEWTASLNDTIASAQAILNTFNYDSTTYMKHVAYEGGQHILTNSHTFAQNPASYDMYKEWLNGVDDYFHLTVHYTHTGTWASGGAWGAKNDTGQSLADAHKYRALLDWNNGR